MLHYFISPYAGVCMMMAIILNRTVVFASSRRHDPSTPQWPKTMMRLLSMAVTINNLWKVLMQFAYIYPQFHDVLEPVLPDDKEALSPLLWGVFIALCLSQFLETFVSITSGQTASNDTGLTLFEHSLAFQECQMMTQPSPQLLIMCCFSLITQIVTHVVGLLNYKKYQLIPSTVLGISFLVFYCMTLYTGNFVYLPSVVRASVFPQLFVLAITLFCLALYGLAVAVNGGNTSSLTYTPMIRNLKNSLNLQLNDDFNSALMRFGFIMFTAVENKEYVNELSDLTLSKTTYLEQHHLVSGYLNKLENNPELLDVKEDSPGPEEGFIRSWTLVRKFANMARFIQALFKVFIQIIRFKSGPKAEEVPKVPRMSQMTSSSTTTLLDDALLNDQIDDSEDFQPDSESDTDPLEYDSELEDDLLIDNEYVPTLAMARLRDAESQQRDSQHHHHLHRAYPLEELFGPNDLMSLISPADPAEISFLTILRSHLQQDQRLTRRKYSELNQDELLREVIHQSRPLRNEDQDPDDLDRVSCVVCQIEPRSVVLWPCKCFSLCEGCRISLGVRGFGICVCCRAQVEGYSKVYIP
jgi:hypothetical protein